MNVTTIGMVAMAALYDAVAEIMTGHPVDDEKAVVMATIEANHEEIERFYEGARAAFRRDPGNAIALFLSVSLADIAGLSEDERASVLDALVSTLHAARRLGYLSEEKAAEIKRALSLNRRTAKEN